METKKRAVAVFEDNVLKRVDIFEEIQPSSALAMAKSNRSYEGKDFLKLTAKKEEPKDVTLEVHGSNMTPRNKL